MVVFEQIVLEHLDISILKKKKKRWEKEKRNLNTY